MTQPGTTTTAGPQRADGTRRPCESGTLDLSFGAGLFGFLRLATVLLATRFSKYEKALQPWALNNTL